MGVKLGLTLREEHRLRVSQNRGEVPDILNMDNSGQLHGPTPVKRSHDSYLIGRWVSATTCLLAKRNVYSPTGNRTSDVQPIASHIAE
jgi:hypothetical protein